MAIMRLNSSATAMAGPPRSSNIDVSLSWGVVESQEMFRVLGHCGVSREEPARINMDAMTIKMLVIHHCCSDDELCSVRAVYCGCMSSQPSWDSALRSGRLVQRCLQEHIELAAKKKTQS